MVPRVSVVIPVHNAADTVGPAILSILRQTLHDIEILLVDDGSNDSGPAILARFARQDPRVRVITLPHGGIVKALNTGTAAASGELIARMDADDVSHPRRIEMQAAYMEREPSCSLLGCRVRMFPRPHMQGGMLHYEAWLNSVVTPAEIARDLFIESPFAHPSVMFRKTAFDAVGGYRDMGWPEDYDLWLRFAAEGLGMAKLPETLLFWRNHLKSLSRLHGMYSPENFRRVRAHFLMEWRLKGVNEVQIWGAGRDGKTWAKLLRATGFDVVQFIDIDRKKVGGKAAGGIPVVWPADIIRGVPILCVVGIKGVREMIRDYLLLDGFTEPSEFIFLA